MSRTLGFGVILFFWMKRTAASGTEERDANGGSRGRLCYNASRKTIHSRRYGVCSRCSFVLVRCSLS